MFHLQQIHSRTETDRNSPGKTVQVPGVAATEKLLTKLIGKVATSQLAQTSSTTDCSQISPWHVRVCHVGTDDDLSERVVLHFANAIGDVE